MQILTKQSVVPVCRQVSFALLDIVFYCFNQQVMRLSFTESELWSLLIIAVDNYKNALQVQLHYR